jgi:hypothetical protein
VSSLPDVTHCTISRVPLRGGSPSRKQCSLKLADMLKAFADLGGMYPEAVELLQQAQDSQSLTCRVRVDAFPQATDVFALAQAGRTAKIGDPDQVLETLPNNADLGPTPTLYEVNRRPAEAPAKPEPQPGK